VAKELPEKTRVVRPLELSDEAMAIYTKAFNEAQAEYLQRLQAGKERLARGEELQRGEIQEGGEELVLLTHLRRAGSVAKVEATIEVASEVVEQGGKPIIFTEFVESVQKIAEGFRAQGLAVELLTDETPAEQRPLMVERFQSGQSTVWVSTIKAGGLGLTLTASSEVFLVDRPWMVDDATQAEDRAHRLGQVNPVTAYWLQAFPVDEKIDGRLEEQRRILAQVEAGGRNTLRGLPSTQQMAKEIAAELFGGAAKGAQS